MKIKKYIFTLNNVPNFKFNIEIRNFLSNRNLFFMIFILYYNSIPRYIRYVTLKHKISSVFRLRLLKIAILF